MIILQFATVLADGGFAAAIVQDRELDKSGLSTVFWIVLLIGIAFAIIGIVTAPLIAWVYGLPQLTTITCVLSLGFVISAGGNVQRASMVRAMEFRRVSIVETVATVVGAVIALGLAVYGAGVWSLIAQHLARLAATTTMLWTMAEWRPGFQFDSSVIRRLWRFSANLTGFTAFNYWVRNLDNFLIAKLWGQGQLGIYTRAYAIMLLPLQQIVSAVGSVMFPAFSRMQDDTARISTLYLRVSRCIALLTFPMMLGLMVVAEEFVTAFLGGQWKTMIPVLIVLCPVGALQSIGTLNGTIYKSVGRTDVQFRVGLVVGAISCLSFVIGIRWGILGVASCYAVASLINFAITVEMAARLIGLSVVDVVRNVGGVIVSSAAMAIIVLATGESGLLPPLASWLRLAVLVLTGVVSYLAIIHLTNLKPYVEALELLKLRRTPAA